MLIPQGNGIAFSRWGGLGSHRYPIGFSGDTYMEWVTLQFQTSFTVAAANVRDVLCVRGHFTVVFNT